MLFIEPKYCIHINGRSQFSSFLLFVSVGVNCQNDKIFNLGSVWSLFFYIIRRVACAMQRCTGQRCARPPCCRPAWPWCPPTACSPPPPPRPSTASPWGRAAGGGPASPGWTTSPSSPYSLSQPSSSTPSTAGRLHNTYNSKREYSIKSTKVSLLSYDSRAKWLPSPSLSFCSLYVNTE
jgi:hypothetical protein